VFAENGVSCFSRESLEWNSILEIYVSRFRVMLEMLQDSGTKVSDRVCTVATERSTTLCPKECARFNLLQRGQNLTDFPSSFNVRKSIKFKLFLE